MKKRLGPLVAANKDGEVKIDFNINKRKRNG